MKENLEQKLRKCLHAYIKSLRTPLNKEVLPLFSLHKPYIKPTCCLHTFARFCPKSSIFKANIAPILVPIWRKSYSYSAPISINAGIKFSREFDAFLLIQQLLLRVSSRNSLENFFTTISIKTYKTVSFIVLHACKNLKKWAF